MRAAALLILLLWTGAAAAATRVTALAATGSSVTVGVDGPVTARLLALDAPLRLVVDLAGADASRRAAAADGPVTRAQIGQFDAATARLVISLSRPMRVAAATLATGRLELRLAPQATGDFAAAVKRGRAPLALADPAAPGDAGFDLPPDAFGAPAAPPETAAPPPARRGGRKPLVVIDAGHGGKDVGAISPGGGYEKDVTLAVAREVARALAATGTVRVRLTRDDDRFIPLQGRVAIARAAHADLFVSVHADSAPNPQARGASVYTLSDTASDAVAARLAARENKADLIGGVALPEGAADVGDVMVALVRRNTLNTAIAFAETLQAELGDRIAFRGEFHHFAGFAVLKAPDVPSVLLETGYVSNADDAELLFSKAGQRVIGRGIARAVAAHFSLSP